LEQDLISHFLPKNLLLHFSVTGILELCDVKSKQGYYEISLEEHNEILLVGIDGSLYESKGLSEITIQDFPLRGKAVYLKIRRRKWRLKEGTGKTIRNDFSFVAEGSGFTQELSDFLKGTGRYKGGYDNKHRQPLRH
jgi:hypothetical protein